LSLRVKTLGLIAIMVALLGVLVVVSSSRIVLDRFESLEHDEAAQDLQRARQAVDTEINRLNIAGGDWSAWDDTYQFVQDGNQEYIDANLSPDSLANLRVNVMIFLDGSGNLVHAAGLDLDEGAEVSVSPLMIESIAAVPGIREFAGPSSFSAGLISTPEGPLLLSARPVVTSDRQSAAAGTFIIGRYLDEALLQELATTTRLSLSAFPVTSDQPLADQMEVAGSDRLIASTVLTDLTGAPALGLRVDLPRGVYQQGQETIRYLLIVLLGIGLAFGVLMAFLVEAVDIRRVRALSSFARSVKGALSRRAPDLGHDEIGRLSQSVNEMLGSIQASAAALEEANTRMKQEHARVEELNRSLEARVAERTKDLKLANEELRERNRQLIKVRVLAATDGLTGLANHRSFYERAAEMPSRGRPTAVLMFDLDGFKQVNDQFGHQAGDQMLVETAEVFRREVGDDRVFRYGGDEFAVLAEVDSLEEALELGERLRVRVCEQLRESAVTVSVGIALYPLTASSPNEAVYQADSAMYLAKSAGKNAVRIWTPLAEGAPAHRRTA
jgi:diguanylate cyclase (GGDEF)-like protein